MNSRSGSFFKKLTLLVLLGWITILVLLRLTWNESSIVDVGSIDSRILTLDHEVEAIRVQSNKLMNLLEELKSIRKMGLDVIPSKLSKSYLKEVRSILNVNDDPVSFDHEYLRRRIENNLMELKNYISSQLTGGSPGIPAKGSKVAIDLSATQVQSIYNNVEHQYNALIADLEQLATVDSTKSWRAKELNRLADILRVRINNLQNPPNCEKARKLVCNLNKGCGFGCQAHHALFCFILAYGTGRVFVLESKSWRYSKKGWESIFLPLSTNCTTRFNQQATTWGALGWESSQVVMVPPVDSLRSRPNFLPQTVPQDLVPRLSLLHDAPFPWFAGQLLVYLLRPRPHLAKELQETIDAIGGFDGHVVGVHVRRTDKVGTEAAFHPLSEYMNYVEKYFDQIDIKATRAAGKPVKVKRKVFLASDEPQVIREAVQKYPNYVFLNVAGSSKTASLQYRYSEKALYAVVVDILLLSKTEFLVCTFSSQICRVAYELMQTRHNELGDASQRYHSLDDIYYFGGQNVAQVRALVDHKAEDPKEISFKAGDVFKIAGNHWNGYSKGYPLGISKAGLYPSYKVENVYPKAKMGHYASWDDVSSPHISDS